VKVLGLVYDESPMLLSCIWRRYEKKWKVAYIRGAEGWVHFAKKNFLCELNNRIRKKLIHHIHHIHHIPNQTSSKLI
jgi:hypothetical protein